MQCRYIVSLARPSSAGKGLASETSRYSEHKLHHALLQLPGIFISSSSVATGKKIYFIADTPLPHP